MNLDTSAFDKHIASFVSKLTDDGLVSELARLQTDEALWPKTLPTPENVLSDLEIFHGAEARAFAEAMYRAHSDAALHIRTRRVKITEAEIESRRVGQALTVPPAVSNMDPIVSEILGQLFASPVWSNA